MTGRYEVYNIYKESGIDWLGKVPAHWSILSLKSILTERKEKNDPIKTKDILSLTMDKGVIPYSERGGGGNKAKDNLTAYKLAYPNDIVLNSMNVVVGSVGLSKYFGAVSPVYYMLYPRRDEDKVEYFNHIFQSETFQRSLLGLGNGILMKESESSSKLNTIRMRIPMEKLNTQALPRPSEVEQAKIATFLDHETSKIDTLIQKQQQLIELLKEKCQAVISHAVTKGLNPDAPMKDSGVEWFGEIPEEWMVSKVKYKYTNLDGQRAPLSAEERSYMQGKYPYYGASGVIDHVDRFIFDENLVLVSEDGANLLMRSSPISFAAHGKYWVNNHAHILRPHDSNIEFWTEAIEAMDLTPYVTGAAQPKFTSDALRNLVIVYPIEKEERDTISLFINDSKKRYDKLIEKSKVFIELMKEHRTALISAAVTGKIDVRNWQSTEQNQTNKENIL